MTPTTTTTTISPSTPPYPPSQQHHNKQSQPAPFPITATSSSCIPHAVSLPSIDELHVESPAALPPPPSHFASSSSSPSSSPSKSDHLPFNGGASSSSSTSPQPQRQNQAQQPSHSTGLAPSISKDSAVLLEAADGPTATTNDAHDSLPSPFPSLTRRTFSFPSNKTHDSNGYGNPIHTLPVQRNQQQPRRRRHRRAATANGRFYSNLNYANLSEIRSQSRSNSMLNLNLAGASAPAANANGNSTRSHRSHPSASSLQSVQSTTTALKSTQLLGNMMQAHKNRDPYRDYFVLGCLGKGSIGSVEKVVRRRRGHSSGGTGRDGDGRGKGRDENSCACACCGAGCCACDEESHSCNALFPLGLLLSQLLPFLKANRRGNAFRDHAVDAHSNNSKNNMSSMGTTSSINSESSAFSAPSATLLRSPASSHRGRGNPTTDTSDNYYARRRPHSRKSSLESMESNYNTNSNTTNNARNDLLPSSSAHGNSLHPFDLHLNLDPHHRHAALHRHAHSSGHYSQPHPLRRYALKSIRLDRTTEAPTSFFGSGGSKSKSNDSQHRPSRSPNSTGSAKSRDSAKRTSSDSDNNNADNRAITATDEAELRNEISILRSLSHPNIVKLIETYEYRRMIYLVLDLCQGGDLYVRDPYEEWEAKEIMTQLMMAVGYMHRRGIVHRDLKYENVMFVEPRHGKSRLEIKIIDFGLSKKYANRGKTKNNAHGLDNTIMTDFVGTIYTMSPEVLKGHYTYKTDVWSLGVMAYMLLSSQIPFCGKDMKEIAKRIMRGTYNFSGKRWSRISRRAKDFVSSLLVRDPTSRPTADHALRHPWLTGSKFPTAIKPKHPQLHRRHSSDVFGGTALSMINDVMPKKLLDSQICTSIENFSTYSWLHRLGLMVIAHRFTAEETSDLRLIFTAFDEDNTGAVDVGELRKAFALHDKYSDEEIDEIFLAVDMNGSGKISWTEFLAATIETKGHIGEEEFADAFERLDYDRNGYIGVSDVRQIVGRDLPQSIIDQIIDESDITRDHKIWKEEFLALAQETIPIERPHQRKLSLLTLLKRSNSASDMEFVFPLDLRNLNDSITSELSADNGDEQFNLQKAKSVRKAAKIMFET